MATTTLIVLSVISLLTMLTYVISTACVSIRKNGHLPSSVSSTYYLLCQKHKWIFGAVLIACALLVCPAILQVTPDPFTFTAFISAVGLMMIGTAPNFNDKFEFKIHATGAFILWAFGHLWASLMIGTYGFLQLWIAFFACVLYGMLVKKMTWDDMRVMFYGELITICTIYGTLFYKLISILLA